MTCLDDPFSHLPLYSSRRTVTARTDWRAILTGKVCTTLGAIAWVIALGTSTGFALPPTPETSNLKQTLKKPGGFLPGPFQVGSGAVGSDMELPETTPVTEGILLTSLGEATPSATRRLLSSTVTQKIFSHQGISVLTYAGVAAAVCAILGHMMASAAAPVPRDFNYRVPPAWSPENDSSYSFRAFVTDVSLWIMLTDLQPHQQCAAIITRLGGAAREMARMISPQECVAEYHWTQLRTCSPRSRTALPHWTRKQGLPA